MYLDFEAGMGPIADATRQIEYAMRPFKPGHVYFEVIESFKSTLGVGIIVHVEHLKSYPLVVEVTDEMHSYDIPNAIGVQMAKHLAGIHVPVDDHIQLGEE
jgi:hypothetical protein